MYNSWQEATATSSGIVAHIKSLCSDVSWQLSEQVCREHGLWLHVDAAWGGAALLSRKLRRHMAGCEHADSMCWNPHKLLVGTVLSHKPGGHLHLEQS